VERVEEGDTIGTADDCLAIQGEGSRPQLGGGAGNRWIAIGPI
jgi:hypothetical protein